MTAPPAEDLELAQIMDCTPATVLGLAERTEHSSTVEQLVFREAELGALYCTAEMAEAPAVTSPYFLAELWSTYEGLTTGQLADAAAHLRSASAHLGIAADSPGGGSDKPLREGKRG